MSRRYRNPAPGRIVVTGLLMDRRDREALSNLEERDQWHVRLEDNPSWETLTHLESPIIIWDRDLPGEDWRDVVHLLATLPHRPCVLLLSRVVDDYLWNEVVRFGGFDVLSKPLKEAEVLRVVRLAWSYWASTAPTK
jgi:FixJ family two-component response regulator